DRRRLLGFADRCCDMSAYLGDCMRARLREYRPRGRAVTLVLWPLSEPERPVPPEPTTRRELFGDAALGLLYSGNFGRAHSYEEILSLARHLRSGAIDLQAGTPTAVRGHGLLEDMPTQSDGHGTPIGLPAAICFAVRGNRADELRKAVRPDDANVTFAGFAPESELEKRLAAADVHLVSLRPEWTGVVVPSKFFGSL